MVEVGRNRTHAWAALDGATPTHVTTAHLDMIGLDVSDLLFVGEFSGSETHVTGSQSHVTGSRTHAASALNLVRYFVQVSQQCLLASNEREGGGEVRRRRGESAYEST